jgi:hypothetical protein
MTKRTLPLNTFHRQNNSSFDSYIRQRHQNDIQRDLLYLLLKRKYITTNKGNCSILRLNFEELGPRTVQLELIHIRRIPVYGGDKGEKTGYSVISRDKQILSDG